MVVFEQDDGTISDPIVVMLEQDWKYQDNSINDLLEKIHGRKNLSYSERENGLAVYQVDDSPRYEV